MYFKPLEVFSAKSRRLRFSFQRSVDVSIAGTASKTREDEGRNQVHHQNHHQHHQDNGQHHDDKGSWSPLFELKLGQQGRDNGSGGGAKDTC